MASADARLQCQEAGEKASEVGVAATHRRDGLDPRGTRRDGSVLGAQVGEPFRRGDAGVGGPELDEPGDAQGEIPFLDKVEACYALGLVLVGAHSEGFDLSAALSTDGGESTTV